MMKTHVTSRLRNTERRVAAEQGTRKSNAKLAIFWFNNDALLNWKKMQKLLVVNFWLEKFRTWSWETVMKAWLTWIYLDGGKESVIENREEMLKHLNRIIMLFCFWIFKDFSSFANPFLHCEHNKDWLRFQKVCTCSKYFS